MSKAAVFDANVLLQALGNPGGPAGRCLELALAGDVELVITRYVLDELCRITGYPKVALKFPVLASRVPLLIDTLAERGWIRDEPVHQFIFNRDPKDAPYINLAIQSGAMLIVSRDNDLLDLMRDIDAVGLAIRAIHPEFRVVTPEGFLANITDKA